MDDKDYDEIIRKMLADQSTPDYSAGLQLQPGLLGDTPANTPSMTPAGNTSQQALTQISEKNQQNMQNMMATGQQGIQQGMQAAQGLQAQRQAAMDATSQQAAQALQQQQQQESAFGNLLGGLIKQFLIPVKYGGGRK